MNQIEQSSPIELTSFTRSFKTHRLRTKEERERTRAILEDTKEPSDLLAREINQMHTRIIDISILENDLMPGREAFYRLPFLYLPKGANAFQIRVSQYAGEPSSAPETKENTSLMREIDDYLHDRNLPSNHYPHLRELHKGVYAFNLGRLTRTPHTTLRFPINFANAGIMLPHIDFVAGESLVDSIYKQKFDQFADLMLQRGLPFDIPKSAFKQWIKTKAEPKLSPRIYDSFDLHVSHEADHMASEFRTTLQKYFQIQATNQR